MMLRTMTIQIGNVVVVVYVGTTNLHQQQPLQMSVTLDE